MVLLRLSCQVTNCSISRAFSGTGVNFLSLFRSRRPGPEYLLLVVRSSPKHTVSICADVLMSKLVVGKISASNNQGVVAMVCRWPKADRLFWGLVSVYEGVEDYWWTGGHVPG